MSEDTSNESSTHLPSNQDSNFKPWGMDEDQYCMFLHLSQLASLIVPMSGFVLPIVMWVTNKEESPRIDAHGKVVLNWIISLIIYAIIGAILTLILIGVIGLIALSVCAVVFSVVGAIKANNGELYKYPLSFEFIK